MTSKKEQKRGYEDLIESKNPQQFQKKKQAAGFKKESDKVQLMEGASKTNLSYRARKTFIILLVIFFSILIFKFIESLLVENPEPSRWFPDYFSMN